MDKRILTSEELLHLTHFIKSRGFKEPSTVAEILDHFACKVEELLSAQPGLRFDQAVQQAHLSFGYKGFGAIAEAYETGLRKKYRMLYWRYFLQLLQQPLYFIMALGVGFAVLQSHQFAFRHGLTDFMDRNLAPTLLFAALAVAEITWHVYLSWSKKRNLIVTFSQSQMNYGLVLLYVNLFTFSSKTVTDVPVWGGWIAGLVAAYACFHFPVRYRLYKEARTQYEQAVGVSN